MGYARTIGRMLAVALAVLVLGGRGYGQPPAENEEPVVADDNGAQPPLKTRSRLSRNPPHKTEHSIRSSSLRRGT